MDLAIVAIAVALLVEVSVQQGQTLEEPVVFRVLAAGLRAASSCTPWACFKMDLHCPAIGKQAWQWPATSRRSAGNG